MELAGVILIATSGIGIMVFLTMLVRNEWVYAERRKLFNTPDYHKLPSYNAMMRRWLVWDINKFLE